MIRMGKSKVYPKWAQAFAGLQLSRAVLHLPASRLASRRGVSVTLPGRVRPMLRRMKVRDIVRFLRQDGWYIDRIRGSHHHHKHPSKPQTVTVPVHRGHDLGINTVKCILKQAGINP
jgi:predicted RNA binding protein YcfA (HicA-like mRNA interferase family)